MYHKAISLLFKGFNIFLSFNMLLLAIVGSFAKYSDPAGSYFVQMTGLILPVSLLFNLILLLFWLYKKSYWALIPLLAFIFCYNYIFSIVQIDPFSRGKNHDDIFSLKIASYNVHGFYHNKNELSANYISEYIAKEQVGILCMQEYMPHDMLNKEEMIGTFEFLPYWAIRENSAKEIGLAIFSKYPIIRSNKINFDSSANGVLWADILLPDGKIVRIINAHLQTTGISNSNRHGFFRTIHYVRQNFRQRSIQANTLRTLTDTTVTPIILCGDLNSMPSSYIYRRVKGNLTDGFREAGFGFGGTFSRKTSPIRIDYIMHSKEFECIRYYTESLKWSDHIPVLSELEYKLPPHLTK